MKKQFLRVVRIYEKGKKPVKKFVLVEVSGKKSKKVNVSIF